MTNTPSPTKQPETNQPGGLNNAFNGAVITGRLQMWPSEQHPGMWDISGKEDHLSALATPGQLVELAHIILRHFGQSRES